MQSRRVGSGPSRSYAPRRRSDSGPGAAPVGLPYLQVRAVLHNTHRLLPRSGHRGPDPIAPGRRLLLRLHGRLGVRRLELQRQGLLGGRLLGRGLLLLGELLRALLLLLLSLLLGLLP